MTRTTASAAAATVIVFLGVAVAPAAAQGTTIFVNAGGNLQAALDQAQPGQTIQLEAGATFTGNFVLPRKTGTSYITIRTSTPDGSLPSGDTRIRPEHEALLPTIRSANVLPALRTATGAHHWRIMGVRFTAGGTGEVIVLGDSAQADRTQLPSDIVLDRIVIRGAETGVKRGIALNCASTFVRNSYIAGVRLIGQESQAIAGWNGPGPFVIENNYIEAGGIGILFGGAEPAVDQLVPSDIVIKRNLITRPVEWRTGGWVVKNLLELKNARRVLIEGNTLENNWLQAQNGYAVLFTVRAHGTRANWSTVEHVRFQNNVIRRASAGINILGRDGTAPSQVANDIVIRNNLFTEIDHRVWGGNGVWLQIGGGPFDVHVEHNTVMQTGNIIAAYGGTVTEPQQVTGFRFNSNIVLHNTYGIIGDSTSTGNSTIAKYFPASVIIGNAIGGGNASLYPAGNVFPSVTTLMAQFENPSAGDYRLRSTSTLRSLVQGVTGVEYDEMTRAFTPPSPTPRVPTRLHIVE